MTANKISLYDETCQESESFSLVPDDIDESPLAGGLLPQARYLQMEFRSGELSYQVSGEQPAGVGSQLCDHETSAWHPRFASVNHALTRLVRTGQ